MKQITYILIGALLLPGCGGTLHKDYRYSPQEQDLGWGVLYARLQGTDHGPDNDVSYRGSPYTLTVSFAADSDKAKGCELMLDEVSLVSIDDRAVALKMTASKTAFKVRADGIFKAYFSFKVIGLKYEAHELTVTYYTSSECPLSVEASSTNAVFEKDYEERKITFWDALMGV